MILSSVVEIFDMTVVYPNRFWSKAMTTEGSGTVEDVEAFLSC